MSINSIPQDYFTIPEIPEIPPIPKIPKIRFTPPTMPKVPSFRTPIEPISTTSSTDKKSSRWRFLIPTIGVVALGSLFIPNVGIGLALGFADFLISCTLLVIATVVFKLKQDENSDHEKFIDKHSLYATLIGPILEEGIFRGVVQPLTARAILLIIPAAGAAVLGSSITIATAIAIATTAVAFGAIHALNKHKQAHIQAGIATVGGISLGLIAARFGLGASMAAHILNNTLAISIAKFAKSTKETHPPAQTSQASMSTMPA